MTLTSLLSVKESFPKISVFHNAWRGHVARAD